MRSKIYKPEVFQGNLKRTGYFEGYYFKLVSEDQKESIVIIAGVSLGDEPHAFIQVLIPNENKNHYIRFDLSEFSYEKNKMFIKIGENLFTQSYLRLYLDIDGYKICGMIWFDALQTVDKKWWRPGVMGPFSFLTFMECYHGVISMTHHLKGTLEVGKESIKFSGGRGYIEKAWGTNFPQEYIWIQSNQFEDDSLSIMLVVAKVPLSKFSFKGVLGCITVNQQTRVLGTYTGLRVKKIHINENEIYILLKQRKEQIKVKVKRNGNHQLIGPAKGNMERMVDHDLSAELEVTISYKNRIITKQHTKAAALEITQDINSLIKE